MGYYSEVGICLASSALMKFDHNLREIFPEKDYVDVMALLSVRSKIHETADAELWFWNSIKWYPDDKDVIFIEDFLSDLSSEEYLFIRIGEDNDDSETRGEYYDNPFGMYLSRSVKFHNAEENL